MKKILMTILIISLTAVPGRCKMTGSYQGDPVAVATTPSSAVAKGSTGNSSTQKQKNIARAVAIRSKVSGKSTSKSAGSSSKSGSSKSK